MGNRFIAGDPAFALKPVDVIGDNCGHVRSACKAGAKKLLLGSLFGFDRSQGKWQLQPRLVEYNPEEKEWQNQRGEGSERARAAARSAAARRRGRGEEAPVVQAEVHRLLRAHRGLDDDDPHGRRLGMALPNAICPLSDRASGLKVRLDKRMCKAHSGWHEPYRPTVEPKPIS